MSAIECKYLHTHLFVFNRHRKRRTRCSTNDLQKNQKKDVTNRVFGHHITVEVTRDVAS